VIIARKIHKLCLALLVVLATITLVVNGESSLNLNSAKFGLFAKSEVKSWANPCKINYVIARINSSVVNNRHHVLIKKHSSESYLSALKSQYSRSGEDKPDGRVKLYSCSAWLQVQSKATYKNFKSRDSEVDTNGYYVIIKLKYLPNGFWPRTVTVHSYAVETFVRRKNFQCQIGPMYESEAKRLKDKLAVNQQLILRWLGRRVANNNQGFYNLSSRCVLNYKR